MSLLAENPNLIGSPQADKAFWLLTDGRLRDMYSGARDGQALSERLMATPFKSLRTVFDERKKSTKSPEDQLQGMIEGLEAAKKAADRKALLKDIKQHNDPELKRLLAQLATAESNGDREAVARLNAQISSNRKQVD